MSGLIWPKFEPDRAFIPVLVTSNFDDDSIKNERASMETAFSHYKSMGFLDAKGQLTPWSVIQSGRNSNSSEILFMSSLPASIKRIGSKTTEKRWRHHFLIISQWGFSVAMETRVLIQSAPKLNAAFPPTPMMLHIKFDQDLPISVIQA